MKRRTIHLLFFYVVFILFYIILKNDMLSIVEMAMTDYPIPVPRLYYFLLCFVIIIYLFRFFRYKVKGKLPESVLLLLIAIYLLAIIHSFFSPLESMAYYLIIALPLLMFLFVINIPAYLVDNKCLNGLFLFVYLLLALNEIQLYGIRTQDISAITCSSSYVILYFLPFVLCENNKKLSYVAMIIAAVTIFLSFKRAGLVALIMAFASYWLVDGYVNAGSSRNKMMLKRIITLVILFVIFFFVFMRVGGDDAIRIIERFQNISDDGGSGRVDVYKCTLNMIMESDMIGWLFGHGWNSVLRDSPLKLSAHNDLLEVVYEFGLIVSSIYIYMLCQLVCFAKRLIKEHSRFAPAFTASLVVFFVNSMVSHILIYSNYMSVFTAFWAYVYIKVRQNKTILYEKDYARLRYPS